MKWSILALLVSGSMLPAGDPVLPAPLLAELKKEWPANRTVNLVFHGHSVPAGYHKTPEVKPFESYPLLALARIKESNPHAVMNAIVTAIGGENSLQGAARFERDVLAMRPDVVFIDYALNDRGLPEAKVEAAWRAMARAAQAKGVSVVFLTPTGASDVRVDAADEPLERCAALIRRVGAEEGVVVADVWAAWKRALGQGTDQASLSSQSNHPNRAGHDLAAREIARVFAIE